jgi:hypothetical protein
VSIETAPTFTVGVATWPHGEDCALCGDDLDPNEPGIYCETSAAANQVWHFRCAMQLTTAITEAVIGGMHAAMVGAVDTVPPTGG